MPEKTIARRVIFPTSRARPTREDGQTQGSSKLTPYLAVLVVRNFLKPCHKVSHTCHTSVRHERETARLARNYFPVVQKIPSVV